MKAMKNLSANLLFCLFIIFISCTPKQQETGSDTPQKRNVQTIAAGFEDRRMKTLEKIINAELPEEEAGNIFVNNQVRALAILYHAHQLGDDARVDRANELLMEFARNIDESESWAKVPYHGGAAIAMRTLILFEDNPELLYPETIAKLKYGVEPNGDSIPEESLQHYIPITCYNPEENIGFYEWEVPFEGAAYYTENHRLQMMMHALLVCQIYGDQTYNPPDGPALPLRNETPEIDDYWGYWKKAYYDYLKGYEKPKMTLEPWMFKEFRHMDWGITEKDGTQYTQVFLGDFWLMRDLLDDPVINEYSEMFIDLTLADYAEEAVKGIFVGAHENSEDHAIRLPGLIHIYNYLLFDDLPYEPAVDHYYGWGFWGFMSILTSEYNPTHQDFPKVLIDMAVNKPQEGYMVREGINQTRERITRQNNEYDQMYARTLVDEGAEKRPGKPKATWVKPDYSLGFGINSWGGWGYHAGGTYVATGGTNLNDTGLAVLPFAQEDNNHFDLKYSMICPMYSVVGKGAAITQNGNEELPSKIWIRDGFTEDFETHDRWMFFAANSIFDRRVYLAIRPVLSGYHKGEPREPGAVVGLEHEDAPDWAQSTVPEKTPGKIMAMDNPIDYLVWEMGDEEDFKSFQAFKQAVLGNTLEVSEESITYISSKGEQLTFNRQDHDLHQVNGTTINYDDYAYVVNNPWGVWKQNTKKAQFSNGDYSVRYNFDPNGNGVFVDEMPEKIVDGE